MNKWMMRALILLLAISVIGNFWFFLEYRQYMQKLEIIEEMVSHGIERNIRQSMRQIDFLLDNESPESFQRLQGAMEELAAGYMQWVLMNQTAEEPNERMKNGLAAMESMRNTVASQLERQYQLQNQELMEPDREMLSKMHDHLGRLLLIYHNIQGRLDELNNPLASDGGLSQLSEQIQETSLLYRHSVVPNHHPSYLNPEEALRRAAKKIDVFAPGEMHLASGKIRIREGVHTYEVQHLTPAGQAMASIDARDGWIREYKIQDPAAGESETELTVEEALEKARILISHSYTGRVSEEFVFNQNGAGQAIFLFRFTPITDRTIALHSDAYYITVLAATGEIIHFKNDFSGTSPPDTFFQFAPEEIRQEHQQEFGRMLYDGTGVIRTFATRFRPRLVYSFRVMRDGQPSLLYVDAETGQSVHEAFDLFQFVNP